MLQAWWDEANAFIPGTTSSVIADYLDELGWEPRGATELALHERMRPLDEPYPGTWAEAWEWAAGVYPVGSSTTAQATLLNMARDLVGAQAKRGKEYQCIFGTGNLLVGPDTASIISASREYKDWLMSGYAGTVVAGASVLGHFGLARHAYGLSVVFNEYQPLRQVDLVVEDSIVTARIY